ncbi:protein BIG GRAIN 1-like B [Primulina eburnea]|uniref:protein BIG GRAIN 1-like B n=1 Tax=Primulina eburnea TaxID=1245227 RepID=UPI003C6C5E16
MYSREKSRKNHRNELSFSSTLLDEIYRSIDANADNTEDSKFFYRDNKLVKGQVNFRGNGNYCRGHRAEDEEMASFRRGCLVEKWMLKEENGNLLATRGSLVAESENKSFEDKDLLYFSSNSISSESSGALSSSPDTDFFSSPTKSRVSCFSSVERPKPVRFGGKNRQDELDDYKMGDENLFKSKSRALKIYASLRKMKQPISPGGKLTSFINSVFNHANEKKLKNADSSKGNQVGDLKSVGSSSNISSASRSCLTKKSPKSREKTRNGIQRTVRFDPVSVILNGESRPCGPKSIIGGDCKGFGRHSSATNQLDDLKLRRIRVKNRTVEEDAKNDKKSDDMSYGFRKKSEEDDEDSMSDSSSDLFELDHLSSIGRSRLPIYETMKYFV